jgi:hypothetical protein
MNNPAYDIVDILAGISSLALTAGTDLFENEEPSKPDDCVTVYDTSPHQPPRLGLDPDDKVLEYPSIQVRVRNRSAATASSEAWNIKTELHGMNRESQGGSKYLGIWCSSGPFNIVKGENNRTIYTINFEMVREEE